MARVRIDDVTGCWIWTGPTSGNKGRGAGYPGMSLGGQTVAVHIVMWINEHGYIPGKKELDHVCRNRLCVRHNSEDHLQLVSRKRNILRQWQARKAASQIGHNGGPPMVCEEA
ncbi:HNH endonuclease signature motif containing protein [Rhizobium leguminosarum]|uniref:HNH endonuclease signature motif containing protein n=1 Tax=Rhizobium leguminosarum TaxID=384 RepID=UPI001C96C12F|nr:HNH endonuclease signature motif containing protein [Rhizobium leguminosarum]MBY5327643.1 HNH endonuclease [Rhizobium leguminosarum]